MEDKNKKNTLQSIGDVLKKFNPVEDKYISREFQSYGIYLAEQLNDMKHRGLYIKLARDIPRSILEKALSFVKDADVDRKGALFMWKLKKMNAWKKAKGKKSKKKKSKKKKSANKLPF